ncbi:MAG: peroxiredoxin-like family protein [Candidatus Dormibacteria bacterium]|jgi:peroxiredoxin
MSSPSDLAGCRVVATSGEVVRLGDEWRERPAVVVWLRHFGCLLCREQAAAFRARREEVETLGARLVFVGNGDLSSAREFEAGHCRDCRVLTDPGLDSYRAIGARRGWRSTIGPSSLAAALRAFRHGHRQGGVRGIPDQQGGVHVVLPGDRVVYAYLSGSAGDHPPVDAVLDALRAAVDDGTATSTGPPVRGVPGAAARAGGSGGR